MERSKKAMVEVPILSMANLAAASTMREVMEGPPPQAVLEAGEVAAQFPRSRCLAMGEEEVQGRDSVALAEYFSVLQRAVVLRTVSWVVWVRLQPWKVVEVEAVP